MQWQTPIFFIFFLSSPDWGYNNPSLLLLKVESATFMYALNTIMHLPIAKDARSNVVEVPN